MKKNKTAVEWLFEKLWDEPKDKFTWYALREKALQMEKEQIEISDEKIEKAIIDQDVVKQEGYCHCFLEGAKWYREQLKNK